jgi:hypothetical protein
MLERRAYADAAFLDCAGAETDEVIARKPERDIDLRAHAVRFDAEDSG